MSAVFTGQLLNKPKLHSERYQQNMTEVITYKLPNETKLNS